MPAVTPGEAAEMLAKAVERAAEGNLADIYAELFPSSSRPDAGGVTAAGIAAHIRAGIEPEEIVDLWNVLFPADRNVYYDEEEGLVRYNGADPRYIER